LLELRQLLLMRLEALRLAQRQRRLEIGLDDIGRRRQDICDEVVAELDAGIEGTADLQFLKRVTPCQDDGGKSDGQQQAESNDRGGNRQTEFHVRLARVMRGDIDRGLETERPCRWSRKKAAARPRVVQRILVNFPLTALPHG